MQPVLEMLQKRSAETHQHTVASQEATFLLPSADRSKFAHMFHDLETQQTALQITSFGVSITTLEEVFLKYSQTNKYHFNN
jgi:hypothetical protein